MLLVLKNISKNAKINVETETSQPQGTKRKRQQSFDEYKFAFTSKDQIILESLLIRAFCLAATAFKEERHTAENIALGFATTMKDAEGDETFLSTAYLEYQQLKAHVRNNTDLPKNICEEVEKFAQIGGKNFLYNPVVIVAYKLDPRYREKPLTIEGWVEKVLQKKAIREAAKGNNEQEIDVESDFSDLDFQSYSDLEELLDEELNEFQD
ncbi:unnamed protein product [Rhizophagus irregularis]|nr:unnamed protein product [Rhizophagus irregularis]